jgi:hypothetical protein
MPKYPMLLGGSVLGLALASATGCQNKANSPTPLNPQAFLSPNQKAPAAAESDNSSAAPVKQVIYTHPAANGTETTAATPATAPVTVPATQLTGASLGTYMTVGTVLAEANGQPIYADKVLAKADAALAAKARERDTDEAIFRKYAAGLIYELVDVEIYEELEYASAERAAADDEKSLASALTTRWRQNEIIKAGGSLAVARKHYLDQEGIDFDERVQEEYRRTLVKLHYTRRIFPLVNVTADEMRSFYDQNLDRMFSEKAAVRFRVIKVDIGKRGGPERAAEEAKDIWQRAKSGGADFAQLAEAFNDDPTYRKNKGWVEMTDVKKDDGTVVREPRWIPRGTFARLEAVEKAVFDLQPGQVTDIIDTGDALYVARLEEKQGGATKAFDDPLVQAFIREKLTKDQQRALRDKERAKLMSTAIHRKDEKMLQTAVDMAMQRYGVLVRTNAANGAAGGDARKPG